MLNELERPSYGCQGGDSYVGSVAYADDIILLAPTIAALKNQVNIVENFASENCIKFNGSKSKLMYVGKSVNLSDICVKVNNERVEWCKNLNYLGHDISNDRTKSDVIGIKKDFVRKFHSFSADMASLNSNLKSELFYKYCMSLYGVLFCEFSNKGEMDVIYKEWRKAMRRIWKLPYRTHGRFLSHIAECVPIDIELKQRFLRFFSKGIRNKNKIVNDIFSQSLCSQTRLGRNFRQIVMSVNGVNRRFLCDLSMLRSEFNYNMLSKTMYDEHRYNYDREDIRLSYQIKELILIRDGLETSILNSNECQIIIDVLATM